MPEELKLKNRYITVITEDGRESFGGDQGWVRKSDKGRYAKNNRIRRFGCGLVSAVDILKYLGITEEDLLHEAGTRDSHLSVDAYIGYLSYMERKHFHVSYWLGVPGTRLARRMNRIFRRNRLMYRAKWGMNGKRIFPRIMEMLDRDIPVMLSIGPGFGHKERLPLYVLSYDKDGDIRNGNLTYTIKKSGSTKDHYVTVTGVLRSGEKTFLEISSWGRKLFVDFDEYIDYIKRYDNYIFSNILYIK